MVWDFIANIGRQRVNAVQGKVQGKVMSAQAKAKSKASAKINKGIDNAAKGAAGKAKGKAGGGADKAEKKAKKAKKGKDEKMGLFGRSKNKPAPQAQQAEPEPESNFGDKTQFIQVVADDRPKECVGWVVALSGPLKGQDFRLTPGKNIVGTAADSDIVLTDQYMSSRHAVIRYEDGIFVIVDLDSTNGTYVNDDRCSKEELIDNDRLRVGRTELKFKSLY